jgi:excisionase family DNA binding protein
MPEVVLLTTSEVAERFRVHPATVRRWVEADRIKPAFVTPTGQLRFSKADIDDMAQAS